MHFEVLGLCSILMPSAAVSVTQHLQWEYPKQTTRGKKNPVPDLFKCINFLPIEVGGSDLLGQMECWCWGTGSL